MRAYEGYHYLRPLLAEKYGQNDWLEELAGYLQLRYVPIENRLKDTFRYVECSSDNKLTYSYEYSSLLRDIGGVFGSAMNILLLNISENSGQSDIADYKMLLCSEIENIDEIGVLMYIPFVNQLLFPFQNWSKEGQKLPWWDAYSELKHGDFNKFREGNLENVVNSLASLAILMNLTIKSSHSLITFFEVGYFSGINPNANF